MCELLPSWDAWLAPTITVAFGLGLLALVLWLVVRKAVQKVAGDSRHWTERARSAAEFRSVILAAGVTCAVVTEFAIPDAVSASGCTSTAWISALTPLLVLALTVRAAGAVRAAYHARRGSLGARLRSLASTLVVLWPSLLVGLAAALLSELAPSDARVWLWVAAVAVALVGTGTGALYGVGRALGFVVRAREKVLNAVAQAQSLLPTEVTAIDEIAWLMPNALAFPLQRRLAFTVTAAELLTSDELEAIALHELGHLHESTFARWFRPLQSIVLLPFAVAPVLLVSHREVEWGVLLVAALAFTVYGRRRSRRHERDADAHASAHSNSYALALETIYRLAGIPAVVSRSAIHPSLYDRMLAAGVTPDYPRPKQPRRSVLFAFVLFTPLFMLALELGPDAARSLAPKLLSEQSARYALVALRGTHDDLLELAQAVYVENPKLGAMLMIQNASRAARDER